MATSKNLQDLPNEFHLELIKYLRIDDVICLALTNKSFYNLILAANKKEQLKDIPYIKEMTINHTKFKLLRDYVLQRLASSVPEKYVRCLGCYLYTNQRDGIDGNGYCSGCAKKEKRETLMVQLDEIGGIVMLRQRAKRSRGLRVCCWLP